MKDWTSSDFAAWWGAIVASLVFGWEIWKHVRSGPRLRITVSPNMVTAGNGVISKVQMIFVTVVNCGDQATELTHFLGVHYRTKIDMWTGKKGRTFIIPRNGAGPEVPFRLEPGSRWTGGIEQGSMVEDFGAKGVLCCGVIDAASGKATYARMPMMSLKPQRPA